jgi:hypothetical protein
MIAYGNDLRSTPNRIINMFPIFLTRSGYPRAIPAFHRRMIHRKDEKADKLVKFYLSLFSVTGIIPLAKKAGGHK